MRAKKKSSDDPEQKERIKLKKQRSYKSSKRDKKHHCRVGSVVDINGEKFLVCITTALFVYIIKQNGNHRRLTWEKWDNLKPHIESSAIHIKWTKKIKEALSFLRKKIKFEGKLKKKFKREPVIRRTPVKRRRRRRR